MPSGLINRSIGRVAEKVPGLRALPVVRLLAAAEVAMLAHDHVQQLTPQQRRRLFELVRTGRGRKDRLTEPEAAELTELLARLQTRRFLGDAVRSLSPVPLPGRVLYGPGGRPTPAPADAAPSPDKS